MSIVNAFFIRHYDSVLTQTFCNYFDRAATLGNNSIYLMALYVLIFIEGVKRSNKLKSRNN